MSVAFRCLFKELANIQSNKPHKDNTDFYQKNTVIINRIMTIIDMNRFYLGEYRSLDNIKDEYIKENDAFDLFEYIKYLREELKDFYDSNDEELKKKCDEIDRKNEVRGFYYYYIGCLRLYHKEKYNSFEDERSVEDESLLLSFIEYIEYWFGVNIGDILKYDINKETISFFNDSVHDAIKIWGDRININDIIKKTREESDDIESIRTKKCEFEEFFNNIILKTIVIRNLKSDPNEATFYEGLNSIEKSWLNYFCGIEKYNIIEVYIFQLYLETIFKNSQFYKNSIIKRDGLNKVIILKVDWNKLKTTNIDYFKTLNQMYETIFAVKNENRELDYYKYGVNGSFLYTGVLPELKNDFYGRMGEELKIFVKNHMNPLNDIYYFNEINGLNKTMRINPKRDEHIQEISKDDNEEEEYENHFELDERREKFIMTKIDVARTKYEKVVDVRGKESSNKVSSYYIDEKDYDENPNEWEEIRDEYGKITKKGSIFPTLVEGEENQDSGLKLQFEYENEDKVYDFGGIKAERKRHSKVVGNIYFNNAIRRILKYYKNGKDGTIKKKTYSQIDGIRFMWNRLANNREIEFDNETEKVVELQNGCILAHVMGVGKTLEVIILLFYMFKYKLINRVLIVAPNNLIQTWQDEFEKYSKDCFFDPPTIFTITAGNKNWEFQIEKWATGSNNVLLITLSLFTNYMKEDFKKKEAEIEEKKRKDELKKKKKKKEDEEEDEDNDENEDEELAISEEEEEEEEEEKKKGKSDKRNDFEKEHGYFKTGTNLLVVDEAHSLSNPNTIRYKCIDKIDTRWRILMTGTPIQNEIKETFALINLINTEKVGKKEIQLYTRGVKDKDKAVKTAMNVKIYKIFSKYIHRSGNAELVSLLPEKKTYLISVNKGFIQSKLYYNFINMSQDNVKSSSLLYNIRRKSILDQPSNIFKDDFAVEEEEDDGYGEEEDGNEEEGNKTKKKTKKKQKKGVVSETRLNNWITTNENAIKAIKERLRTEDLERRSSTALEKEIIKREDKIIGWEKKKLGNVNGGLAHEDIREWAYRLTYGKASDKNRTIKVIKKFDDKNYTEPIEFNYQFLAEKENEGLLNNLNKFKKIKNKFIENLESNKNIEEEEDEEEIIYDEDEDEEEEMSDEKRKEKNKQTREYAEMEKKIIKSEEELIKNGDHRYDIHLSNKSIILFEIIKNILKQNGKLIIFAKYLSSLNAIEDMLKKYSDVFNLELGNNIKRREGDKKYYLRADGKTRPTASKLQPKFKEDGFDIFLLTFGVGGVGLNLQVGSNMVFYDIDVNPVKINQAMTRIYRKGQQNKVNIYFLLTEGSFELKTYLSALQKDILSMNILDVSLIDDEETIGKEIERGEEKSTNFETEESNLKRYEKKVIDGRSILEKKKFYDLMKKFNYGSNSLYKKIQNSKYISDFFKGDLIRIDQGYVYVNHKSKAPYDFKEEKNATTESDIKKISEDDNKIEIYEKQFKKFKISINEFHDDNSIFSILVGSLINCQFTFLENLDYIDKSFSYLIDNNIGNEKKFESTKKYVNEQRIQIYKRVLSLFLQFRHIAFIEIQLFIKNIKKIEENKHEDLKNRIDKETIKNIYDYIFRNIYIAIYCSLPFNQISEINTFYDNKLDALSDKDLDNINNEGEKIKETK